MACGKTSVARQLSEMSGFGFVDLDRSIASKARKSIPCIFRDEGEAGFRVREREALQHAANRRNVVLSCGGGVVLLPENRALLRERFFVVWIRIDASESVRRAAQNRGARPLLDCPDPLARAVVLLQTRNPLYGECADCIVDTSADSSARTTAETIYDHFGSRF